MSDTNRTTEQTPQHAQSHGEHPTEARGNGDVNPRHRHHGDPNAEFVQVTIYATGGIFPEAGAVRAPANQKLRVILEQAAKALEITDWSSWVATVDGRELAPERTLKENGLHDEVAIDWGPREGGGG